MKHRVMLFAAVLMLLSACGNQPVQESMESSAPTFGVAEAGTEAAAPALSAAPALEAAVTTPESAQVIPSPEPPSESDEALDASEEPIESAASEVEEVEELYMEVGGRRFSITLADNETAAAFQDMLPAVWGMEELHGNEKYIYLDDSLPADAQAVGYIEAGDIMLYGDSCVVLFYDSFSTSYGYTRIGWVDDPAGLAEAVGSGDVTVEFGLA